MRPRESGHTPSHARPDPVPGRVRPGLTPTTPAWPAVGVETVGPADGAWSGLVAAGSAADIAADSEPAWPDPGLDAPAPAWPEPVAAAGPEANHPWAGLLPLAPTGPAWPDPITADGLDVPGPGYEVEHPWSGLLPTPGASAGPGWSDLGASGLAADAGQPAWPDPISTAGVEPAWPDPEVSVPEVEHPWAGPAWTDPGHVAGFQPAQPDSRTPELAAGVEYFWAEPVVSGPAAGLLAGGSGRPVLADGSGDEWVDPEADLIDLGAPPLSSVPTAPLSLTRLREAREKARRDEPVVHTLPPETPARGLRKFDLGTVPASVTPPRTWRKAAWFAVGTSAAVMVGLAYAAVEFVGEPGEPPLIDALPAYPTRPWNLEPLPAERTTSAPDQPVSSDGGPRDTTSANPDTAVGDSPVVTTTAPGSPRPTSSAPGGTTSTATPTVPAPPSRTTVGQAPVTPTNPQAMGDVTEAYFKEVTSDPAAAHELTSGGMAREGAEAIEARYAGVERVEVQDITIDRNQATTTSTVKIVREDGTETIEQRQLSFTWGGDPKITDESTTA